MVFAIDRSLHALRLVEMTRALRLVKTTGEYLSCRALSSARLCRLALPRLLSGSLHALRLVEMTGRGYLVAWRIVIPSVAEGSREISPRALLGRDDINVNCHVKHCRDISFFDAITMPLRHKVYALFVFGIDKGFLFSP